MLWTTSESHMVATESATSVNFPSTRQHLALPEEYKAYLIHTSLPSEAEDRIHGLAEQAWGAIVPRTEDREPLTIRTTPYALAYLIPYFYMAYLGGSATGGGHHGDSVTFGYVREDPLMVRNEWNRGLMALVLIAKSIDFAFAPNGRLKTGEKTLPSIVQDHTSPSQSPKPGAKESVWTSGNPLASILPRPVFDALDVGLTMRGVGYDFGQYVYIHLAPVSSSRSAFVRTVVPRLIRNYMVMDVLDTVEKRDDLLPHLPPIQRYTISTALHALHGLLIYAHISVSYDMAALTGVLVLKQSPSSWPPVQGDLRSTRSLHRFWSRTWHQTLRHTFLLLGGFPGRWLAGDVGVVFGTFLASGLFHELGLMAAGKAFDHKVVAFFLLQAVGICLEKTYYSLTGRRVGGVAGAAWDALFVLGFGQMCSNGILDEQRTWACDTTGTVDERDQTACTAISRMCPVTNWKNLSAYSLRVPVNPAW
ncbi:hypothetical protein L227DRAFT_597347 [Lentinus tigrinus ALCF2SS1-6]|uniref:Wax synthase domain-containing protein n=2 Tax=Lentinus tigrinus TaxID=5365 RepID=A0A5C2SSD7_9APHY|nr:hypothetical protein L227DRAFT_597347 [Lentinus tigrinus ALCF2SS1-6]